MGLGFAVLELLIGGWLDQRVAFLHPGIRI